MARSKTTTTSSRHAGSNAPLLPKKKAPVQKAAPILNGKHGETETNGQLIGHVDSRELLRVLTAVKNGNFTVRMPIDQIGLTGKICDTLNEIIAMNEKMMLEFTKAGNTIGKQGKLNQRIELPNARGAWRTGVESLNI